MTELVQYSASISYGKDSLAMLHVITDVLHKPLDRIVTAEVWATDTIQADLPPMVEFKEKADRIIKERWGIEVEHLYATDKEGNKLTYEKLFYHIPKRRTPRRNDGGVAVVSLDSQLSRDNGAIVTSRNGHYKGFPLQRNPWCPKLKYEMVKKALPRTVGR